MMTTICCNNFVFDTGKGEWENSLRMTEVLIEMVWVSLFGTDSNILTGVKKGDSFKNIILIKILLFILWIPKPFFFMTYVYCWEKIAVGHSSDWKSFNPFTAKCGQRQNSIKNPKFHFVKFWKTSSSTMWKYRLRGFIDWLQHRILSTDSKVRATLQNCIIHSGVKCPKWYFAGYQSTLFNAPHPSTPRKVQGALILLRGTMFQNKVSQVIMEVK